MSLPDELAGTAPILMVRLHLAFSASSLPASRPPLEVRLLAIVETISPLSEQEAAGDREPLPSAFSSGTLDAMRGVLAGDMTSFITTPTADGRIEGVEALLQGSRRWTCPRPTTASR